MTMLLETVSNDHDIDAIISALSALRRASQAQRYGHVAPPQLPSKFVMASIVEGITAVLYPRPPELPFDSTDEFIASTLKTCLGGLREQVRREFALFPVDAPNEQPQPRPKDIVDAFARAIPRVRTLLDADIRAAYAGDPAAKSLDEIIFCYPGVAALIKHRLAHELYRLGVPMMARIVAEIAHSQTGIDIHPGAEIDQGFFIDHGTGVVIGETARIGKNVRLYQAVTLGAKRFDVDENGALEKGKPRHPILEDDVVIYAGATVLGRITIGRGSTIGGNVWLTHSVPPGSNITQAKARIELFDHGAGI
ncbi:serine O-acetyltransferase EpsC [Methylocystis suflitae]|uniref:serine O-acetyltransferase EpsC n=1 Tax=Methylocystis suflitae TaxID=2951405 RepID=UPI002109828E|nr:serine O-acetyltransferase EpsC [Methylocystis suflitae]MCQ4190026.1 serine acetyltransferase [Methylocystis suflitae]